MDLTIAEVNMSRLETNIEAVSGELNDNIKILAAVKGNGYGHGIEQVAELFAGAGIDYLGVSNIPEALAIRRAGVKLPTLVLMPSLPEGIEEIVGKNIDVTITDIEQVQTIHDIAAARNSIIPVQVNVDTGMGRTGISPEETLSVMKTLYRLPGLEVRGIFSHLSSAHLQDRESIAYTDQQIDRFSGVLKKLDEDGILPPLRHVSSSDPVVYCKDRVMGGRFNMVRLGELIYGHNSKLNKLNKEIQPAMSVTTRIMEVRKTDPDQYIGYGRTYKTDSEKKIGLISVGYAGGLDYRLSNRGKVLVRDKLVPIIGEICMNETLIDLTGMDDVRAGEEVIVLGSELTADRLGDWADMYATEILASFSGVQHIYR